MAETMEIFWEFNFEAAHRLPNVLSDHKCARSRGHSYQVQVDVKGEVDARAGWVIDFGSIKDACKPVVDQLDHHYLNEIPGLENQTSELRTFCARLRRQRCGKELGAFGNHSSCAPLVQLARRTRPSSHTGHV